MCKRLACMMVTFFPSCMQRCIIVSRVLSTHTLSVLDLGRTGGTVSLRSVSGAGMMAQGRDKVVHHAQAAQVPQVGCLLVLLVLQLPACRRS